MASSRSSAARPCGSGPAATAVRSACRMTVSTGAGNRPGHSGAAVARRSASQLVRVEVALHAGEAEPGRFLPQPGESLVEPRGVPGEPGSDPPHGAFSSSGTGTSARPGGGQPVEPGAAHGRGVRQVALRTERVRVGLQGPAEQSLRIEPTARHPAPALGRGCTPPTIEFARGQQPAVRGRRHDGGGPALEQEAGVSRVDMPRSRARALTSRCPRPPSRSSRCGRAISASASSSRSWTRPYPAPTAARSVRSTGRGRPATAGGSG